SKLSRPPADNKPPSREDSREGPHRRQRRNDSALHGCKRHRLATPARLGGRQTADFLAAAAKGGIGRSNHSRPTRQSRRRPRRLVWVVVAGPCWRRSAARRAGRVAAAPGVGGLLPFPP